MGMGLSMLEKLVEIKDLRVSFRTYGGSVQAVRGVSLDIFSGECLAIVGESGCGKSVTAQSLMRLIPDPPAVTGGKILFQGEDILSYSEKKMRQLRGAQIGMIFQDPMTSLDPTMPIGRQIAEGLRQHNREITKQEASQRVVEVLTQVGISEPQRQLARYPYEFSGGMRQRVVIAMAVICRPKLLIADEPTTALDVTTQAQILDLLKELRSKLGTAVVLITHDMGVVSNMADRVCVFYAGQVVEEGSVEDIFYHAAHPYTVALLRSRPRLDRDRSQKLLSIPGTPPDLFAPPEGCAFFPRCGCALEVCREHAPEWVPLDGAHGAACWLHHEGVIAVNGRRTREEIEEEVARHD